MLRMHMVRRGVKQPAQRGWGSIYNDFDVDIFLQLFGRIYENVCYCRRGKIFQKTHPIV